MAVLTGFLRPGPTTIWSFPPMKIYQVWSFHKNRKLTNIFFLEDLREFLPTKPPPPKKKKAEYLIRLVGESGKTNLFACFFSQDAGVQVRKRVGWDGSQKNLTRSGFSWERWEGGKTQSCEETVG